jgi:Domain of unknown function (DUF3850)
MTTHRLKTWPEYYDAAAAGIKTFDVRADDRGFAPGDRVILACYDPDSGTFDGREMAFGVPYVLRGGNFGIKPGYAVLSLAPVPAGDAVSTPRPPGRRPFGKLLTMTRKIVSGAYRVLIGLKVSEDMAARIDSVRGQLTRADWLRAAADTVLRSQQAGTDWERRARDAEERLARMAEILARPELPS